MALPVIALLVTRIGLLFGPVMKVVRWLWERKAANILLAVACLGSLYALRNTMDGLVQGLLQSWNFLSPLAEWLAWVNYAMPFNEAMAAFVLLGTIWTLCAAYKWISAWT